MYIPCLEVNGLMIIVYFGDLIVAGTENTVQDFYTEFGCMIVHSETEELIVDGPPVTYLGFEYYRKKDHIEISPPRYTEKVLQASDFQLMRWVGCGAYVSGGLVAEPMCRFQLHNIATSWLHLTSWNFQDSQLS